MTRGVLSGASSRSKTGAFRNIILRGFTKIVKGVSKDYGNIINDEQAFEIAKSPEFQQTIINLIKRADAIDRNKL